MTYEGWTNYETWAVKLWLDNEYGSYKYVTGEAERIWAEHEDEDPADRVWKATSDLASLLKDEHEEGNPLEDEDRPASVYSDLLRAALSEVNWYEIGEAYVNDAKEAAE